MYTCLVYLNNIFDRGLNYICIKIRMGIGMFHFAYDIPSPSTCFLTYLPLKWNNLTLTRLLTHKVIDVTFIILWQIENINFLFKKNRLFKKFL